MHRLCSASLTPCSPGHRTNWLTIFDDQCGAGYFYDASRRHRGGEFFYHFDEMREYRFFPSLATFFAGVVECYETGIYRSVRHGQVTEDIEQAYTLWDQYAASPRI